MSKHAFAWSWFPGVRNVDDASFQGTALVDEDVDAVADICITVADWDVEDPDAKSDIYVL